MSNGTTPEPTKTPRQQALQDRSTQLFRDGKVIEAGWTALLAIAIPAQIQDEQQLRQMRAIYFAAAKHTFTHTSPWVSDGDESMEVYKARHDLLRDEIDAFVVEVDEQVRAAPPASATPA